VSCWKSQSNRLGVVNSALRNQAPTMDTLPGRASMKLSLSKAVEQQRKKEGKFGSLRLPPKAVPSAESAGVGQQPAGVFRAAEPDQVESKAAEKLVIPIPGTGGVEQSHAKDAPPAGAISDADAAASLLAELRGEKTPSSGSQIALTESRVEEPVENHRPELPAELEELKGRLFQNPARASRPAGGQLLLGTRTLRDLDEAPPEPDSEAFMAVPVDDFGAAMLRGMGATESMIESREGVYEADAPMDRERGEFLGLGAARDPRLVASAQERRNRRLRNAHAAAAEAERQSKLSARAQRFAGIADGRAVRMIAGPFRGLFGVVEQADGVPGLDRMRVRSVEGDVKIARKLDGEVVDDEALSGAERQQIEKLRSSLAPRAEKRPREEVSCGWLRRGVRVRFCVPGSGFFRSKGTVVAVADDGSSARVQVEHSETDGVTPADVQTALPKAGGRVTGVSGRREGMFGTLVERVGSQGSGSVQWDGVAMPEPVCLDDIAEWVDLD
jgi:hypothetical protein